MEEKDNITVNSSAEDILNAYLRVRTAPIIIGLIFIVVFYELVTPVFWKNLLIGLLMIGVGGASTEQLAKNKTFQKKILMKKAIRHTHFLRKVNRISNEKEIIKNLLKQFN